MTRSSLRRHRQRVRLAGDWCRYRGRGGECVGAAGLSPMRPWPCCSARIGRRGRALTLTPSGCVPSAGLGWWAQASTVAVLGAGGHASETRRDETRVGFVACSPFHALQPGRRRGQSVRAQGQRDAGLEHPGSCVSQSSLSNPHGQTKARESEAAGRAAWCGAWVLALLEWVRSAGAR